MLRGPLVKLDAPWASCYFKSKYSICSGNHGDVLQSDDHDEVSSTVTTCMWVAMVLYLQGFTICVYTTRPSVGVTVNTAVVLGVLTLGRVGGQYIHVVLWEGGGGGFLGWGALFLYLHIRVVCPSSTVLSLLWPLCAAVWGLLYLMPSSLAP